MVLDFAENYSCTYQNEVQSAHWFYEQVTLHPVTTYYKCAYCQEATNESLVFISPDHRHDHHAVQHYTRLAIDHLRQRGMLCTRIVQWSDGCTSQYKSRGPFADIAASQHDMGVPVGRNYFGSRHGKGPCDGEAAVVKNHVASAVKCRDVIISNACDFYKYLQKSSLNKQPPQVGCPHSHFLRSFVFVGENEICHSRPHRNIKTVPGTRQFHHVKPGGTGQLCARHLTCMCDGCAGGGQCQEEDIVGRWREYTLIPTSGML